MSRWVVGALEWKSLGGGGCSWRRAALESSKRLYQQESNTVGNCLEHLLTVEASAEYWPEFVICVPLPIGVWAPRLPPLSKFSRSE